MPLTLKSGQLPPEEHRVVVRDPTTGGFAISHEPATEESPLTVGSVYGRLTCCKFEVEAGSVMQSLTVKTEDGEVILKGPPFSCMMLRELLALKADGIEPFSSLWFWFDSDSCMPEPDESYSFFVVCGDKIVREEVRFSDYSGSGFNPDVFDPGGDSSPIWRNEAGWSDARTKFWYRKFYNETRTGQLMALRSDQPVLYHYEAIAPPDNDRESRILTQVNADSGQAWQILIQAKIYRLLWVAFPLLVAIAFPTLKAYMAIMAGVLAMNFLAFCWTVRKIGKT